MRRRLRNYLERQTYRISTAPAQYEQQLQSKQPGRAGAGRSGRTSRPTWRAGEAPRVELVLSSANPRSQAGASRLARAAAGLCPGAGDAAPGLARRGAGRAAGIEVDERDLASPAARAAQWATLVPFFVLMAVLYGALHAALDTTAGERERGSLEPLLMNPVLARWRWCWASGARWRAVAMLIAVLSCASFLPGQWLLRSETLAAMFRFGIARGRACSWRCCCRWPGRCRRC